MRIQVRTYASQISFALVPELTVELATGIADERYPDEFRPFGVGLG